MGRQDQGLVGHTAPNLAACLQGGTQPLQSTVPSLGQLPACPACPLPSSARVHCYEGSRLWLGLEATTLKPVGLHGAGSPCAGAHPLLQG